MKNFNSFFNQLTAMPKRLAMVLTVLFTLGVGSVLGTSYISYNGSTQDESTTISSTNVSNGSAGAISWQGTSCTYSDNRVNISANGSITFSVSGENLITKIVVTSGSTSSYYGTWTSTSGSVSSSSGTTTISDINAASVTIKTSTAFRCTSASSIKIYYDAASSGGSGGGSSDLGDCNVTYDFTKIDGFSSWGSGYTTHTVSYADATVTFASANKQSNTITDQPVTKGGEVSLVMKEGNTLSSVTWVCTKWSDKSQTITLHYSTNGGSSYTTTGVTSTNFTISKDPLPAGTNAVKITFSSSKNQVGISSCSIEKVCTTETTITLDLDGGSFDSKPDGWEEDGNNYTKTVNSGDQVTLPEPNKTGHDFEGWYNASTKVTSPYTLTGNTTLTAHWTPQDYTITYKDQGDVAFSGTHENNHPTQHTYGTATTLKSATKSGYNFLGWFTTANCSSSAITQLGATDYTDDITLYAKWEVAKTATSLTWSAATYSATIDADNTFPILTKTPDDLTGVTYSSSNTGVATIDANTGEITLKADGTTTITATFTETATHTGATASYTLTVHPSNCRWVEIAIEDIKPEDEIVVTMGNDKTVYALGTEKIKNSPKSQEITITSGMIDINQDFTYSKYTWSISAVTGGYTLQPYGTTDTYLYGVKSYISIGNNNTNNVFTIFTSPENGNKCFMYTIEYTSYYLGHGTEDGQTAWKQFPNYTNLLKSNTLKFYKKTCLPANKFWIDYELANVTCTTAPPHSQIDQTGEDLLLEFSANGGYKLPETISVKMGETEIGNDENYCVWDKETGDLLIVGELITDNITITIEGCEQLAAPENLLATNITSTSAVLSWDAVAKADEYIVFVTDGETNLEIPTTNCTITIEGLSKNTYYLWDVTATADNYCDSKKPSVLTNEFTTLDVYTVTFNTDGGTDVAPQTLDHGGKATKPANPTKTGYTFAGWYTEADTEFNFNTPIESATTLYAKWNANQYTITFLKQYGAGGTDKATVTFNSNHFSVVTIELPTRDGYEFGGYYTETGGAGLQIVDAEGKWLKNKTGYLDASGNWIKAESVNLYAKWTKIHTITWVVNNNTETPHYTSKVLDGNTIDELPNAPADDLFEDCEVNAFVGWSTDNIGLEPDATAPTDLFKTLSEAQSKIGAINGDKKFYAVYASEIEQIATFEADGLNGLSANSTLKWTHDNSGISLAISAGQRYTGSPKTFTITNGTSNYCEIVAPEGKSLKKAVVSITESKYKVNSVSSPWLLSTSSTTQTITTSTNATDLKMYATSSYQIRITQVDVTYTTYSNYITRCTALPDPVWGGATIDKTEIAVKCGETSSTNGAARISFPKETNYNLYKDITVEVTSGNFIIASSRDGEYTTSVTLTPTQSGTNVGTLDGKYVYVRAVAPPMSSNQLTGTITISGKQITTQVINVTATVTCNEYTLTFNDCGETKTITDFAGTSVEEMEPWAETCSEPFQYMFDGWATAPVTNGTEEYEKVDFSTYTMPNNNTTILYAVYRYAEEGGEPVNGYVKVTEALTDWSGDYVIVDDEFNVAIQNTYEEDTKDNKTLKDVSVTIENDKIVSPTNDIIWTISKFGEYYTVYNAEAIKYAGITKGATRAAGLSETIATGYSMNIIFDSNTKIAKVSSTDYNRCFSYSEAYPEWRTYSNNDANGKTGYLYRFSNKTIRYTSSLVCGTIEAEDAIVTSTVGQTVKVYVPITLGYSDAASITGTSDNEAFTVVTKNDVAVGESNIEVHYKPTAYVNTANQEETATITLTTSNAATTTFNITGRCLPETFAIVAKVGNVWYALPSQGLNSTTPPAAYPVEVDNMADPKTVTSVPANADWALRQVYASSGSNDRFTANGENLVFVNDANPQKALNAGSTRNYLLTDAQYDGYHTTTNPGLYEWTPTTTDLETYTLTNAQRTDRTLNVATNTVFGVHSDNKATTEVRFLPIQNRYTPAALQVVEWKENSVVVMYNGNPAQTASVSVNGGAVQTTELSGDGVQKDIAVYELAANGLATNPTQSLSITIGSEKVILPIPYIVGGDLDDATLLGGNELTIARRQEIAKISDLVILNGGSVTAERISTNYYKFRNVTIYGGGSLIIPAGKGFGANTLTMRVGGVENRQYKNLYPQLQLNGTLTNTSEQINLDYLTTNEFYYPLSVPYPVNIADIQYPVDIYGANVKPDNTGSFQFKYYDGAERAAGRTGWIVRNETANPTLNPNTGYAIWGIPKKVKVNGGESTRQKFGIHRLPLKQTAANMMISEQQSHSATINVYNGSKRDSDNGWNYLGNPYLSHYGVTTDDKVMKLGKLVWDEAQGAWLPTDTEQRYVVFTNDCQNYTAELASTTAIPAFSAFFIQADQGGAINFTSPNVATPQSLAARRSEEETKEITTGIILSGEKHSDRTGLLIADQFTEAYEFNADLSKFDNQDMNLYTISSSGKLAFMAINEDLAKQTIPLGYAVSTDGMYSIAFDEQRYSRNDIYALYLIDYDRNETTNLLHMDYNFYSETGAHAERFALQVAFAPNTSTDVEYTQVGDVLLSREGNTLRLDNLPSDATVTVYDAVGHLVEQHTASQLLQLTLQKGYYLLHIGNNQNSVVIDTFIP